VAETKYTFGEEMTAPVLIRIVGKVRHGVTWRDMPSESLTWVWRHCLFHLHFGGVECHGTRGRGMGGKLVAAEWLCHVEKV
jgi:hypothetical protein